LPGAARRGGPGRNPVDLRPEEKIARIVHHRLTGEFIELQPRQKIPLRLPPSGWADLDVICDQLGIARS